MYYGTNATLPTERQKWTQNILCDAFPNCPYHTNGLFQTNFQFDIIHFVEIYRISHMASI